MQRSPEAPRPPRDRASPAAAASAARRARPPAGPSPFCPRPTSPEIAPSASSPSLFPLGRPGPSTPSWPDGSLVRKLRAAWTSLGAARGAADAVVFSQSACPRLSSCRRPQCLRRTHPPRLRRVRPRPPPHPGLPRRRAHPRHLLHRRARAVALGRPHPSRLVPVGASIVPGPSASPSAPHPSLNPSPPLHPNACWRTAHYALSRNRKPP